MAPSLADGQVVVVFYFLFTGYSNLSTMTKWTIHKKRWTDVSSYGLKPCVNWVWNRRLITRNPLGVLHVKLFFLSFPLIYTRPKITKSSSIYLYFKCIKS